MTRRRALGVVAAAAAAIAAACTGPDERAHPPQHAVVCMDQTPALLDGGLGSGSGSDAGPGGGDAGPTCKGLDIEESVIPLVPMGTALAHIRSVPGFTDQLLTVTIANGAGFEFVPVLGCAGQLCNFTAMPHALPFAPAIRCTATDGLMHEATLVAQGAQGPADVDSALLTCAASTTTPLLGVSPQMLDYGAVAVNATKDLPLTIANNGTATLTYSLAPSPSGGPWSAPGSPCVLPQTCDLAPGAQAVTMIRFQPSIHGASPGNVSISSNGGSATVDLAGSGVGSRVAITEPLDHDLDFGTIPRSSTATRTIVLTAVGNVPVTVAAASPGAPFAVAPPSLALSPGMPLELTVSCSSATATPQVDAQLGLSSPNAYALDATAIAVHCQVANTQVDVAPATFELGETRRGGAAPVLPFTISNPGPFAAQIDVTLAGAPAAVSLDVDGPDLPRALAVGESITGRLTLETDEDLDLAQAAPRLEIDVDDEQLLYPVTGKVTTPAAYVTPEKLDLGTACLGSPITGTVQLVNSGTARLTVERPELGASFVPHYESPTSYPAPLAAGATATFGVSPAAQAPGEVTATITWVADAPRAPFVVPVSLAYIESGTALSPASLGFTPVKVGEVSNRFVVTLQNCNPVPVPVRVDGVVASRGGADAWRVEPRFDERTLAPQDKLAITVAFAPKRHGRHAAEIRLIVDGEPRAIPLAGDGLDESFQRTSFYACGCQGAGGAGGAAGAASIVIAVALVVRRRRRAPPR